MRAIRISRFGAITPSYGEASPLPEIQRPEGARSALQFIVRADLGNLPVHQDHDGIGLSDGVVAMRGEEDDLLVRQARE